MKLLQIIAIIVISTTITSCSIQMNLQYNANESGKLAIQMKSNNDGMLKTVLSQVSKDSTFSKMNLMDSLPSMGNMVLPEIATSMFGFSNANIVDSNGIKQMSIEFHNIKSLNGNKEKRDKEKIFFKSAKNSFTIYLPKEMKNPMGDEDNKNSAMMGMVSNMIQSEINLNFERKVKKSNYKKIAFSEDKKSAKIRFNFSDFENIAGKKITFHFEK